MRVKMWRAVLAVLLALGVVSGLVLATTQAFAAQGPASGVQTSVKAWGGCWYIVQPGDNLFRIGLRYGVSPYYLAHLNGLWNPNYIYVGMKLNVPCDGGRFHPPPPPPPSTGVPTNCTQPIHYTVQPGDNLFRIALNHGTTVEQIRNDNNLWGKVLRPGMVLTLCGTVPTDHTIQEQQPTPAAQPTAAGQASPVAPLVEQGTPIAPAGQGTPVMPVEQATPIAPLPTEQAAPVAPPTPAEMQSQTLPPEPSAQISIGDSSIDPNPATITVGQSVVFINTSQATYTIVSGQPGQPNGQFNSGALPPGATFIYTFTAAGSYPYHISENPTLVGQVSVNP